MATTITAAGGTTGRYHYPPPHYRALKKTHIPNTTVTFLRETVASATELDLYDQTTPIGPITTPTGWYSETVTAEVTIAGDITVTIDASVANVLANVTLRAYLWKITAGGSDVQTLIGVGDGTTELITTTANITIVITPPTPVTVAPGEQFIVRLTVIPMAGQTMGGPYNVLALTGGGSTLSLTVAFTETVAFLENPVVRLWPRKTTTIGIDNFLDLLVERGTSTAITGVVATTAGGTEIQWTSEVVETFAATDISAAAVADTANATTYASGSFTPVANRLYLLAVTHSDAAPETTVPTIATTTGLVFVQVGSSIVFDTIASNLHRLTLFRAMKASGLSAGTYTVTLADAGTGCCARLTEVSGVVTTGTDGADAVINVSTNNANAGANPSVTLAAFNDVDNGTYACFASDIATAPTAGSGFTGLGHSTIGTPTKGVFAEWRATNDTTADCTLASSDWAGIAVELVQQVAGAPVLLEWITRRFARVCQIPTQNAFSGTALRWRVNAAESNDAANCTVRYKLFRYRVDGTEELLFTDGHTVEMVTGAGSFYTIDESTGTFAASPIVFLPDERLILRMYIINVGTMAAGHTCTVWYDHDVASGDMYFELYGSFEFKDEGDPDTPATIPDSMSTLGVQN